MNDVLIDLINTPSSLLFKKGLNGHDLVKKKYLWSTISYNYIKVYKWILNDFDRKFKNDINLF